MVLQSFVCDGEYSIHQATSRYW